MPAAAVPDDHRQRADAAPVRAGQARLIDSCPLGCTPPLRPTNILLPEGPLQRCSECSLLVSSCSAAQHEASLAHWDTTGGTTPDARSVRRFRTVTRRRLALALALLPDRSRPSLLDVGCSSGSLLEVAAGMGFAVKGVEIAPAAAAAARRAGFDVHQGLLQDAGHAPQSFDVITLVELIEHVTDPLALLRHCHRLLRPGGVVVVNTPNGASWTARVLGGRWEGFSLVKLGGHICFYSPAAIRVLAERTGFDVAAVRTRHLRLTEPDSVPRVVHRLAKLAAKPAALAARWFGTGHDMLAALQRRPAVPPGTDAQAGFGSRPSR
jgi:2-polyprenyl-3-methyl-5-hydroxy-6-metoxy-1,4-benzoquinol methylase